MKWVIDEQESPSGIQVFVAELVNVEKFGTWDTPVALIIETKYTHLIAAAPELLETLELITFYFSDSKRERSSDINYINIAKAAIARAKGEKK